MCHKNFIVAIGGSQYIEVALDEGVALWLDTSSILGVARL